MKKKPFKKTILVIFLIFLILSLIIAGIFAYYFINLPSLNELEDQNSKQIIRINYDNENLIINHSEIYQSEVNYYELPNHLINAVVAIEDRRFFNHHGIDITAIIRAYFANKKAGKIVQGGSTITQQLAKLLFLKPEKTFKRKIQEALLALQLEHKFTKEQILTFYLNRAYFGSNNYGVGNAAKKYFNKEVSQLNISESAMIAGLLKAPTLMSPKNNPELAKKRTKRVLSAMQECGYINKNYEENLEQDEEFYREDKGLRFYFSDYVKKQIFEIINLENQQDKIIKVTTTLNEKLQNKLEKVINNFYENNILALIDSQIAVIIMNKNGEILGLAGGKNYQESQFNRATEAKRQAGSAFKTFIYLSALENGYQIDDIFSDKKVKINNWLPDNFNSNFQGKITMAQAFAQSSNSVAVQLSQKIGSKKIIKTARLCGITSPINQNDLTIALGTSEISLLELVSGYATILNNGVPVIPYAIKNIKNQDDKILFNYTKNDFDAVFLAKNIRDIKKLLRLTVEEGTAKEANVGYNIYGKTGTSQNYRDAWFIGFDDEKIIGVWIGNDNNSPTAKITGGSLPAKLFSQLIILKK